MNQFNHKHLFSMPSALWTCPMAPTMDESFAANSMGFQKSGQLQYPFTKSVFSRFGSVPFSEAAAGAALPEFTKCSAFCRMPITGMKPWSFAMIPGNLSNGGTGANGSSASSPTSSSPGGFSFPLPLTCNPSLGLFFFAPIVPAADNRPALALLTGFQFLLGLSYMTRRIPKMGESRFRLRAIAAGRFLFGSVLVFLSGIETLRILIPYDPWAEEAREWRRWAVKKGHNPSWWHGAIWYYKPMSISEWKAKTTTWLSNKINELESEFEAENALAEVQEKEPDLLSSISIGPLAVLKAGEANAYNDIYQKLYQKNRTRAKEMLAGDLQNVSELNKAERVDAVLENKDGVQLNEDYLKPNIQLGTHTMQSDEEFEMVWANFEPWDELRQETDYDVRLIPRWRCIDEFLDE